MLIYSLFFLFKQKTAYEMRISDWSSDVCSSDLGAISFLSPCVLPLVPGITAEKKSKPGKLRQGAAVSIEGLTPGVAYKDRKSVVSGKSVSVRVDLGGRRIITKNEKPTIEITTLPGLTITVYPHIKKKEPA